MHLWDLWHLRGNLPGEQGGGGEATCAVCVWGFSSTSFLKLEMRGRLSILGAPFMGHQLGRCQPGPNLTLSSCRR